MKCYATVNEVKKNLPEILERINDLKIYYDIATLMLKQIQDWCVEETVDPTKDYGWWTTLEAYTETYQNQMNYMAEMKYLQGLLKKLPDYKDQII